MSSFLGDFTREVILRRPPRRAIPSLDGPWKANDDLETCAVLAQGIPEVDAIAADDVGRVYAASGRDIVAIEATGLRATVATLDRDCTALLWTREYGLLAAEEGVGLHVFAADGSRKQIASAGGLRCITALASAPDGGFVIAQGSTVHTYSEWRRSLMSGDASGRLLRVGRSGALEILATNLAHPFGVAMRPDGGVMFSEAWRHAIRLVDRNGSPPRMLVDNLPAYPARIVADAHGGWWVSFLALRTHLVEFVQRENAFRDRMMASIPQQFWVAPALSPKDDHRQPQQLGLLRTHGIRKPWGPGRSYGLIAHFDADLEIVETFHSRANGLRHGTLGLCFSGEVLLASTYAEGAILKPLESASA
ncbi:MAG: hypothetical protein KF694_22145 [Mesorhizobium sp.]|nr:hypothetical protein [Mesorhizobium sp.]